MLSPERKTGSGFSVKMLALSAALMAFPAFTEKVVAATPPAGIEKSLPGFGSNNLDGFKLKKDKPGILRIIEALEVMKQRVEEAYKDMVEKLEGLEQKYAQLEETIRTKILKGEPEESQPAEIQEALKGLRKKALLTVEEAREKVRKGKEDQDKVFQSLEYVRKVLEEVDKTIEEHKK